MDFFKRLHQGVEHLLRMGYLEMPARGDPTGQRLTTQLPRQRPHLFTTPARPPAQRPDLDRRATIQLPGELLELPGDQEYLGQFVAAQPSLPGLADAKALGDGGADVVALLQPGGQWRTGFRPALTLRKSSRSSRQSSAAGASVPGT